MPETATIVDRVDAITRRLDRLVEQQKEINALLGVLDGLVPPRPPGKPSRPAAKPAHLRLVGKRAA